MGNKRLRSARYKKKRSDKNRKISFFLVFAVVFIGAIFFSQGSTAGFFIALAIETLCLVCFWILLVYLSNSKNSSRRTTARKVKLKSLERKIVEREIAIAEAKNSVEKYSIPIREARPIQKNFDWAIENDTNKALKEEVQETEKTQSDLKTQVANWSKLVDYSGTVFNRIKEQAANQSQADTIENDTPNQGNTDEESTSSLDNPESSFEEDQWESEGLQTQDNSKPVLIEEYEDDQLTEETILQEEPEEPETLEWLEETKESEELTWSESQEEPICSETQEEPAWAETPEQIDSGENIDYAGYDISHELWQENPQDSADVTDSMERRKLTVKGLYNSRSKVTVRPKAPRNETGDRVTGIKQVNPGSKELKDNIKPPIELLKEHSHAARNSGADYNTENNARKLIDTLASFGVGAKIINISKGPSVTRYELQPDYGVKVSKIVNLTDDIALNLAATGVRIEAPIPGKAAIGIEIPNKEVTPVYIRDVIESKEFMTHPSKVAFAVGKDIAGNIMVADIAKMPHLLIAGATGSGKSVCINTLITSLLYKASPDEVKLLMVDPKVVELSIYNGIPHLLIPVVTDPKKAAGALNWAVQEMTIRYKLFADNSVRDIKGYNRLMQEKGESILPQIVIIIDELADLMMVAPNEVEDCICRLAQMARAAGMHLVIATQRPSVDVITGVIKANVPSRISFAVSSQIDSRTILDMAGAEKLLGRGDMLFNPLGMSKPIRVQGGLITDKEVESIVTFIKANHECEYDEEVLEKIDKSAETPQTDSEGDDELLPQVINMIIEQGQASTSLIQRKFKLGYSRAARIVDQLEANGIVGPFEGSKPRKVLITKQQWMEMP